VDPVYVLLVLSEPRKLRSTPDRDIKALLIRATQVTTVMSSFRSCTPIPYCVSLVCIRTIADQGGLGDNKILIQYKLVVNHVENTY